MNVPVTSPVADVAVAQPVAQAERIQTIDILRGVALLGILLMNIPEFALPESLFRQQILGHPGDTNYQTGLVISILFEGKMRAMFSLLFGAGVILFMGRKEEASGGSIVVADLFYRRMLWMVLFGVIDAFVLLWFGDILYAYGLLGLLVFGVRHMAPRKLVLGAVMLFSVNIFLSWWSFVETQQTREKYQAAIVLEKQHKPLTASAKADKVAWEGAEQGNRFDQKKATDEINAMQGNYATVWNHIRPRSVFFESVFFYRMFWDPLGMMLLGMALLKWGVLTNGSRRRTYWLLLLLGYGIGIPMGYWAVEQAVLEKSNLGQYIDTTWVPYAVTYELRRISMVLGHIGLVMLLYRSGIFGWLWRSLSAVGQMAFSNYVIHTLICTGLFYGYGLGYYGMFQYYQLFYVVAVVWLFQLIGSPIWLRYYQFGPLEWVWRSLTYWQRQPLRRVVAVD